MAETKRRKATGKTQAQIDKEQQDKHKEKQKSEATAYLNSTDWYVIRKAETGEAIPADVVSARQAARTTASSVSARTIKD
jgi:hypothetical protein